MTAMNGKGDKPRPTNLKRYRDNFASINWKPQPKQPVSTAPQCTRLEAAAAPAPKSKLPARW